MKRKGVIRKFSSGLDKIFELARRPVVFIFFGAIVLVALMVVFNSQTGFFLKEFDGNIDEVAEVCNSFVAGGDLNSYCCEDREVVFGGDKPSASMSCNRARGASWMAGRISEMDCSEVEC